MASLFTRNPHEAARFVRSLTERGYRRRQGKARPGGIPYMEFQTYKTPAGFCVVTYYEPQDRRTLRVPVALGPVARGQYATCTTPGCHGKHKTQGLCNACHNRWLRAQKAEMKERDRLRALAYRRRATHERRATA